MRKAHVVLALALAAMPAFANHEGKDKDKYAKQLAKSQEVLNESLTAPDKGIPKDLLARAECVGVFPDLKKGAFVVGGEFGHGSFTCRNESGAFGSPAFFKMGGASVGWQFGGQEADVVLLIMNKKGMDNLLEDSFTLGGEAAAVAGPVGRTAQAATDAQLHAGILSWSRSQGLFLGASLEGNVVKQDKDANKAVYGKEISAREILLNNKAASPSIAKPMVDTLNSNAKR